MLDQSINPDSLNFVLNDFEKEVLFWSDFGNAQEEQILQNLIDSHNRNQNFPHLIENTSLSKTIYQATDIYSYVFMKRFVTTFKTINSLKQASRLDIVNAIIALLNEQKPYQIIRLDIQDFYESIDRNEILEKLKNDTAYGYSTIKILERFFNCFDDGQIDGLPRGLSLSAFLSEYYLRAFDKSCKSSDGIFYYARFVDDIIIFAMPNKLDGIKQIEKYLPKGLKFHKSGDKFKTINISTSEDRKNFGMNESFSYLGYEFSLMTKKTEKKDKKTGEITYKNTDKILYSVDINDKKVKKIKTRIVKAFLDYCKTKNFTLLKNRIRFLTHNYYIHNKHRDTKVKSGIYYNYPKISEENITNGKLSKLDSFLRKMVYNTQFSQAILNKKHGLNKAKSKDLAQMSFVIGFSKKRFYRFSVVDMKRIKKCWSF